MHDGILIGEGVILDARPASFLTRALGALLDAIATLVATGTLVYLIGRGVEGIDVQWLQVALSVLAAVFFVGIPVVVETLSRGRSLGKLATGVRVVRDDGGPVRFRHALIRALLGLLELWLTTGGIALIASLAHPKGKRLGDMVAGTYVIRVRGGKGWHLPLVMPPHLAAWAGVADIRRLPDGLALAARQLLDRAPRLAPSSRAALANELAGRVEPYVAPAPPPGTGPEDFLSAVLHERRDRELARALQERQRAQEQAAALRRLPYGM